MIKEQKSSEWPLTRREALQGGSLAVASTVGLDVLTARAMAQSGGPTDEISGIVEDDNGAVDGATVAAVPHDTSLSVLTTTTAADGTYTFDHQALHDGENLYHVIARDGTESSPRRGEQSYPFIAAEGAAAIPDSENLHAHFDLSQQPESDGETISTLVDQSGNGHDASAVGGPTMDVDGFNGNPTGTLDGADDGWDVTPSNFTDISQAYTVYFVGSLDGSTSTTQAIYEGRRDAVAIFSWNGSQTNWFGYSGSSFSGPNTPGASLVAAVFDGTSSLIETDDTDTATGDAGTDSLTELPIGHRVESGPSRSNWFNGRLSELAVYDAGHDSATRAEFWNYAVSKWGI